jgi:hypothetical protein
MSRYFIIVLFLYSISYTSSLEFAPALNFDLTGYYYPGISLDINLYPLNNENRTDLLLGIGYTYFQGKDQEGLVMNRLQIARFTIAPRMPLNNRFYLNFPEVFFDYTSYHYTPFQFGLICILGLKNIVKNHFIMNPELGIGLKYYTTDISGLYIKMGISVGYKLN